MGKYTDDKFQALAEHWAVVSCLPPWEIHNLTNEIAETYELGQAKRRAKRKPSRQCPLELRT